MTQRGYGLASAVVRLPRAVVRAVARAKPLVARPPRFLSHPDGGLPERIDALAADLRGLVADLDPEAIFLPWFLDGHADHRALGTALERAGVGDGVELWGYETWTPLTPNR